MPKQLPLLAVVLVLATSARSLHAQAPTDCEAARVREELDALRAAGRCQQAQGSRRSPRLACPRLCRRSARWNAVEQRFFEVIAENLTLQNNGTAVERGFSMLMLTCCAIRLTCK